MSSTNLTLTEAQHRAELLSVNHYDFSIDITGAKDGNETFPSTTVVTFDVKEEGSTFIDLIARSVVMVELDGEDITFDAISTIEEGTKAGTYDSKKGIALDNLTVGQHELKVIAECEYSHTGQGLHVFTDPADDETYLYTQFETADAKRVFACFDQPNLKATYTISVTAPAEWEVITNAPQKQSDAAVVNATENVSTVDYPLSTYLIAICAGPYASVTDKWTGTLTHHKETPADQPHELEIPLAIYCRKSLFEHLDAETIFTETKQGFDFYHANFGMAYPFGKYDQLFVPEFNAGAMENAGCVTFRDEYVFTSKVTKYRYERRCDTILHEMAHMWFGDLVTMQWWDDLWLNESFATWGAAISQAEATEYDTAWVTFANVEKSWAYQQDQLPSTHPISTDASDIETVEQNFDGITYAKGASVLKQLQAYVGREEFFAGVRQHFANHAFGNATFDDLLGALEQASGRDLSGWADQWLKTTGINTLSPEFTVAGDTYTKFEIVQSGATPGKGETRTHRTAVGLYSFDGDAVRRTHRVELDVEGERTEVPELIGEKRADLVLVNDDDLTYCLLGLDEDSAAFVVANIDKIEDPMARTLCWSASWEMTRNQQMKARDFVSLVAKGAQHETEIAVLERILAQAVRAVTTYADPAWAKDTGNDILANALVEGAASGAPGSDFQLAFVQALATAPLNDAAVDAFEKILSGTAPFEGLQIDADLKWWALTALIAHGAIDEAGAKLDVEKLSQEDNTSSGQVAAMRALAAVNTDDAKARIWDEVTELPSKLGNLAMRHKLWGLTFTGSGDHLQQFNERYFEIARPIWDELSADNAVSILTGTYPNWDITQAGVDRATAFLSDDSLPAGLKRVISEGRAGVQRALANRAFDAQ